MNLINWLYFYLIIINLINNLAINRIILIEKKVTINIIELLV